MKLFWLGHPRLELDASSVRPDTRKTTALLAYLTLGDRPVSRERLAALFWPDFDHVRAPANLRRSVAAIRASLPGEWLSAERDRIGILPSEDLWVDVLQARQLVAAVKGHAHQDQVRCSECLALLEQAAALYEGDFLEGFTLPDCPEFDDWQLAERESIRSDQGWVLEHLARAQAAAAQWEPALKAARRWVSMDRLREPAQALLIGLMAQSDQRAAALRQYEEFARLLKDELGAVPDPRTRDSCDETPPAASSSPRVSATPGAHAAAGRATRPAPTAPFPGLLRTKLDVPRYHVAAVQRGRPVDLVDQGIDRGLAIVSAPAGFGKSSLLGAWAARAHACSLALTGRRRLRCASLPAVPCRRTELRAARPGCNGGGASQRVYTCLYYQARTQRSMGWVREAMATLEKARDLLQTAMVFPTIKPALDAERIRNWLAVSDAASARAWADQYRQEDMESPLNRVVDLLSVARVRLASASSNAELDETLVLLEELTATSRQHCWIALLIEGLLLQAKGSLVRNGAEKALGAMDQAVRLAHQGGFFQTIVDEGPQAADLLKAGLASGTWGEPSLQDYVAGVLKAF